MATGVEVSGYTVDRQEEVLTDAALAFVAELHRRFSPARDELLARRAERRAEIARTSTLDFLPETAAIRAATGRSPPAPAALNDRRVEITGPTDRKMTINALNSGAKVWLADFEDASAPTWENVVLGQLNLIDAYERRHRLHRRRDRQVVRPEADEELATVVMRPRGWHLDERHLARRRRRRSPARCRLRPVLLPQRPARCSTSARARTSTCRRRSRTWRPASGTTSSSSRRTTSASRRAPSARPSSSRRSRPRTRWRRSSTNCATTPRG